MDHGLLNVPLSKRGNIDAQIDNWKRDQAAETRKQDSARAAILKDQRIKAKAMVADANDDRLRGFAARVNMTIPGLRKHLKSEAHWQPDLVINLLSRP